MQTVTLLKERGPRQMPKHYLPVTTGLFSFVGLKKSYGGKGNCVSITASAVALVEIDRSNELIYGK